MASYNPTEEDALKLLEILIKKDEYLYNAQKFVEYFNNDIERTGSAVKLLLGHKYIEKESDIYASDGNRLPDWAYALYRTTSMASVGLNNHRNGVNPFLPFAIRSHNGDIYHTNIDKNDGSIAIGKKSTANYYGNSEQNAEIADTLQKMSEQIQNLPNADKRDAQYQIDELSIAAQIGPEAVQERQKPFIRWLKGIQEDVETGQAALFIYRLAVILFGVFGIELPALPEGI